MTLLRGAILLSSFSFFYYGITAVTTKKMEAEFKHFGLVKLRALTGFLQLLGAVGLLTGLIVPLILSISSAGLSLLMLIAFVVRIKIRDGFLLTMPSFLFMLLNLYILLASLLENTEPFTTLF